MKKELTKYENACNELTRTFIEKYICDKDYKLNEVSWDWVGNTIGEVVCINDYFINMTDIAEAFRLKCSVETFWEWYDDSLETRQTGR